MLVMGFYKSDLIQSQFILSKNIIKFCILTSTKKTPYFEPHCQCLLKIWRAKSDEQQINEVKGGVSYCAIYHAYPHV